MSGKPEGKGDREGKEPIVLVVDDVQSNRTLISTILRMNGYEVMEAKDQEEALQVSEAHPGPIDLLVADLVLPKANGIQVAHSLRPMRPEMKVLYISGYPADVNVQLEVWGREADFLAKPFTPSGLIKKVQALLEFSLPDPEVSG